MDRWIDGYRRILKDRDRNKRERCKKCREMTGLMNIEGTRTKERLSWIKKTFQNIDQSFKSI